MPTTGRARIIIDRYRGWLYKQERGARILGDTERKNERGGKLKEKKKHHRGGKKFPNTTEQASTKDSKGKIKK